MRRPQIVRRLVDYRAQKPRSRRIFQQSRILRRKHRLRQRLAIAQTIRIRIQIAHRHRSPSAFVRHGAPVRQRLPNRRTKRIAIIAAIRHNVDEIGQMEAHLASLVRLAGDLGEPIFHVLLNRRQFLLPRQRFGIDARKRHVEARFPRARFPIHFVGRNANIPRRIRRIHRRPSLIGRIPIVRLKRIGRRKQILLQRNFFLIARQCLARRTQIRTNLLHFRLEIRAIRLRAKFTLLVGNHHRKRRQQLLRIGALRQFRAKIRFLLNRFRVYTHRDLRIPRQRPATRIRLHLRALGHNPPIPTRHALRQNVIGRDLLHHLVEPRLLRIKRIYRFAHFQHARDKRLLGSIRTRKIRRHHRHSRLI